MSIDDKKQALIDEGVKIRSNASDETIEELWQKYACKVVKDDEETSEVSSFENPPTTVITVEEIPDAPQPPVSDLVLRTKRTAPTGTLEAFQKFHELHATNQEGVRTPIVFDWAMENLPVAEWNKIYAGLRYKGEILKPRA